MKNTLKLFFLFLCGSMLIPQLQAQTIDFESASYTEGTTIYDQYDAGQCGVKFYLDSEFSGLHPKIAEVGGSSYYAFQGPNGTECSTSPSMYDMPAPNQNVGCKFLTDDGLVNNSPHSLVIVWENDTWQTSGYIVDIDGTESWDIEAFDQFGISLGATTIASGDAGTGDGVSTYWSFSNIGPIKKVKFTPLGGNAFGMAFDNFSSCSLLEPGCCGGGDNYQLKNSDFEDGTSSFSSTYTYNGTVAPNSVGPKQYSVVDGNEAAIINPNWNINGATTCTATDKFLLVNGRTTLSGGKVVWRNTFVLTEGKEYIFCAKLKNLPACAFDILPEVQFLAGNTVINAATINADPSDPCDWKLISTPYSTVGASGPVTIVLKIRLDETGYGDGNDLAIDDISVREDVSATPPSTAFTYTVNPISQQKFGITASHPGFPVDCDYTWEVCEVDNQAICIPGTNLSHPSWSTNLLNQTFGGYEGSGVWNPNLPNGIFTYGKRYKIILTVDCPCSKLARTEMNVSAVYGQRLGQFPASDEAEALEQIQLYPNPTQGNITIEMPGNQDGDLQLQIFNEKGQTVLIRSLHGGQSSWNLDLPELSSGLYMVQMRMGQTTKTEKLIVTQ